MLCRVKKRVRGIFLMKLLALLLCLCMLPYLVFNLFFIGKIRNALRDRVRDVAMEELERTAQNLAWAMYQMHSSLKFLADQRPLTNLFPALSKGLEKLPIIDRQNLLALLQSYAETLPFQAGLCLYEPGTGRVLASQYGMTDLSNPRFAWLRDDLETARATGKVAVTPARLLRRSSPEESAYYAAVIYPMVQGASGQVESFLPFYMINLRQMMVSILQDSSGSAGAKTYSLIDREGRIVYHPAEEHIAGTLEAAARLSLINEGAYENDRLLYARPVGGTALYLVAEIDSEALYGWVSAINRQIWWTSVALVAFVASLSPFLLRRLYRPIERVVHRASALYPIGQADDEFKTIDAALDHFEERVSDVSERLAETRRLLRRARLLSAIRGGPMPPGEFAEDRAVPYRLITMPLSERWTAAQMQALLSPSLRDVEWFLDGPDMLGIHPQGPDLAAPQLPEGMLLAQASMPRPIGQLHQSYAEATLACHIARLLGAQGLVDQPSMLARAQGHPPSPELLKAMEEGSEQSFAKTVDAWLSSGVTADALRERVCGLLAALLAAFPKDAAVIALDFRDLYRDSDRLPLPDVRAFFNQEYHTLRGYQNETQRSMDQHVRRLEAFIRENYDKLISLEDVARHLGVSRQYVCYIVKHTYNTTFTNRINQYRVELARQMLSDPSTRINRIYSAVGFSSESYFIRVFKSIYGVPPGEYRRYLDENDKENSAYEKAATV